MRNAAFILTAVVTAAVASLASAQAVQLRWKLEEGDELQWSFHQATLTETGVLGSDKPSVKVTVDMTVKATWLVESADAETLLVRQRIDAIRLTMNALPGDPVVYDSKQNLREDAALAEKELAEKLKPLVGAELKLQMTPLGQIQTAELSQQGLQALGSANPETLKQILKGSLLTLPPKPVRIDATWNDQTSVAASLGELTIQRQFTLAEPKDNQQTIRLKGALSLNPAPREDGAVVRLREQDLNGEIQFDATKGHLVRSVVVQSTMTDSTYRDSRVGVRVRSTLTTNVTRR